jgi:hypothetical protein
VSPLKTFAECRTLEERNAYFAAEHARYLKKKKDARTERDNFSSLETPLPKGAQPAPHFSGLATLATSLAPKSDSQISGLATLAGSPEPLPLAPPMPAARPYPVDALGEVLSGAAKSIAEKIQCSPAMAAQSVLAVASLAAQRLADVHMPFGQTRPLSLYLISIAASGERKSTGDNEALAPVDKHEENLRREYERVYGAWRVSYAAWDAERKKIETDKKLDRVGREAQLKALGNPPPEPIRPILTAPEPTVEGLAKHWPALPGSLGLFTSEGGQMTGGHGFGPDHRLKTAAELSKLWDGCGIRRLRAGDGISHLPGRRLAMHLMVQPEAAEAFLSDRVLRDQGLLSRPLLAAPESLAGTRMWRDPPAELDRPLKRYFAVILALLELPVAAANAAGNELTPRVLELSDGAKGVAFHDKIETQMGENGALDDIRDAAAKAAENAARIAGVLTILERSDATIIETEAMTAGCKLMTWYVGEALRLSGTHRLPLRTRNAIKLLDWLRAKGKTEITRSEVMQLGPNPMRRKPDAEGAISVLEEHGWLRPQPIDGKGLRWAVVSNPIS